MRTGDQLQDPRTGIEVVVLADADETRGVYGLVELRLPGGTRATVHGPDPLPRVELEVLHGRLVVDGRPLRPGEQLLLAPGALAFWSVAPGPAVRLLVEVRPGAHLRSLVQMLLDATERSRATPR
jgi:hypothetical protein